jgi:hypothetical protein
MGFNTESCKIREIALQTGAFNWLKGHGLAFSFKNLEDLFDRAKFNSILVHLKRFGWEFDTTPLLSADLSNLFSFHIGPILIIVPRNTSNEQLTVLNKDRLQEIFKHDYYLLSDEFFNDLRKDLSEPLQLNPLQLNPIAKEKKPSSKKEENKKARQHLDQVERVLGSGFARILAAMVLNAKISGQDAFDEVDKLRPLVKKALKDYFKANNGN